MNSLRTISFLLAAYMLLLSACTTIDVFEKNVPIKGHQWKSADKQTITFQISDTISSYNIFLVFRHSDAYNFNNVWINVTTQAPGDKPLKQMLDVQLAAPNKGWLGSGMDDIFEHRVRITREPFQFKKTGDYTFTLQHTMREDPLENVWNVGIRVEKVK